MMTMLDEKLYFFQHPPVQQDSDVKIKKDTSQTNNQAAKGT